MTRYNDVLALIGRILIAALFLPSGLSKLAAPAATQAYITAMGLPAPALICYVADDRRVGGKHLADRWLPNSLRSVRAGHIYTAGRLPIPYQFRGSEPNDPFL
jgi:uncharacterized membrane protein YphA (DoxX/SURF4 family)